MKIYANLPEKLTFNGVTYKRNIELSAHEKTPTNGTKYRTVNVLSKNLRGKLNYNGKQYQPTKWIYTEA